jgi:peptide/nickel transport system permease protein
MTVWQKLRRKRSGMVSLYTIGIFCLIAIFAYPLAPDNSPDANRMIKELVSRPSGFTGRFLLIPRRQFTQRPFLNRLVKGTPPNYTLLPINAFFFARDTIIVDHYIAKGKHETLAFPLKTLQPPTLQHSNIPTFQHSLFLGRQQLWVYKHAISSRTFLLGTDSYGRDILSRLLIATRISIGVGLVAVMLSLTIGLLLGALAGYYRGWLDGVVTYLINILTAIPAPLLAFAITLSLGNGLWQIFLAVGFTMWASAARLIRKQVIVVRELRYIEAARILGFSDMRILLRHILPNVASSMLAIATSTFAAAIIIEAGLSFLGIGIQPPVPSWGSMISEHLPSLNQRPVLTFIPGIAIIILASAFYTLSNALSDKFSDEKAGRRNSIVN